MKSEFAQQIIGDLESAIGKDGANFSESTPMAANQAIADSITSYLTDNTSIMVGYVGMIPGPPPVPDPVVTDTLKITGTCPPPSGTDFNTWIKSLETGIVGGFFLDKGQAGVTPLAPTPAFLPGLVLTVDNVKSAFEGASEGEEQKAVWEEICDKILTWLGVCNTGVTAPASNSNSGSTGTLTITKTVIK